MSNHDPLILELKSVRDSYQVSLDEEQGLLNEQNRIAGAIALRCMLLRSKIHALNLAVSELSGTQPA